MSSRDVFPARNLGSAEDWGRKVENRTRASESTLESLTQRMDQLTYQMNSLAGSVLPALSRIPEHTFQSSTQRNLGISVAETWVTMQEHELTLSADAASAIVNVSGVLQLVGTSTENDAPWVRVQWTTSGGGGGWFMPDSQGVRSANNSGAVFLATLNASTLIQFDPIPSRTVILRLQGWSSSATNFSSTGASNLASLFSQASSFPERVVSTG